MKTSKSFISNAVLWLFVTGLLAFGVRVVDKTYKVELPLKRWVRHNDGLIYIQKMLKNSDIPARDVTYITDSIIIPLQTDMMQVNAQLDTTKKK